VSQKNDTDMPLPYPAISELCLDGLKAIWLSET